ncbi:MAG: hypothetical protein K5839_00750 [Treponemataceae bacterium]|nr:hypothetical protein [Treponemataceae bacterium]
MFKLLEVLSQLKKDLKGKTVMAATEFPSEAEIDACLPLQRSYYDSSINFIKTAEDLPTSFVAIDFEHLYAQKVSACSVGMVKYIDGKKVDTYYSLIKPPTIYRGKKGTAVSHIHGFTEADFETERTFVEVLPEMEAFAGDLPLVAHNAPTEKGCIEETCSFYQLKTHLHYWEILDTYRIAEQVEKRLGYYIKGAGTHSLDVVCLRFNLPTLKHHNALDDAEMCGNLLLALKQTLQDFENGQKDIALVEVDMEEVKKEKKAQSCKYNKEDCSKRNDLDCIADNPFKNQVIVLTGFSCEKSQCYGHKLHELGADIKQGITKKTTLLVMGPTPGQKKVEKCKEENIKMIDEKEFLELLQCCEQE